MIHIKINFIFITFLLILFTVDPCFAEAQEKKETVKTEIPIEAKIVRSFKIEREEVSRPREGREGTNEMNVTISEEIDGENNTHIFIFE